MYLTADELEGNMGMTDQSLSGWPGTLMGPRYHDTVYLGLHLCERLLRDV